MENRLEELRRETWHGGQLLAFSGLDGPTDFEQGLVARTSFEGPGIDVKAPGSCELRFPCPGHGNVVTGDWLRAGHAAGAPGAGAVEAVFLDAYHLLVEGACEVRTHDGSVAVLARGSRTLVGSAARFDGALLGADLRAPAEARTRWLVSQPVPVIPPAARRTYLKALSVLKTQVSSPEGRIRHRWTTPDRWPHRGMWLWDSAFHAIGWRHLDPGVARDAIEAVLDMQAPDGFVPHMMRPGAASSITQPPVLALGACLVQEAAPAEGWFGRLYPKLRAYVEWDLANRDSDGGGLPEWQIEGDPDCRSGESGMDNSPRFDAARRMDAVDFSSFLALECEILAALAATLGLGDDHASWKARRDRICGLIAERLWAEGPGIFVDYDLEQRALSPVVSSAGFLPLVCGAATPTQAKRLVGHLHDPSGFGTPFPVPSIPARDTARYRKDMWRGPVWVNVNWLIARGLDRYGFHDDAAGLRARTCREIEDECDRFGVLFEFYDDRLETPPPALMRKGRCAPADSPYHQVFHDLGWTAALYVDMIRAAAGR